MEVQYGTLTFDLVCRRIEATKSINPKEFTCAYYVPSINHLEEEMNNNIAVEPQINNTCWKRRKINQLTNIQNYCCFGESNTPTSR